ncbi:NAD(P)H:quinone oxidoreductase, type IV [Obelidium mucronatum]|nr:NAD(P)H:quinone oxidoreductase, type IV [Obelidium mucronatum]
MVKPVVYVVIHSAWGHIKTLADSIIEGLVAEGVEAKLFRVPETLPAEVVAKMHAQTFENIPVITPDELKKADGFLFGFGTRFGMCSAQMKAFWDSTGGLWQQGALAGKYGGCFTSTATQHGGQETTITSFLSHYAHHGIIYVPIGFAAPSVNGVDEVFGGGPWGAGAIANGDGSRQVSAKEKETAVYQGTSFAKIIKKVIH